MKIDEPGLIRLFLGASQVILSHNPFSGELRFAHLCDLAASPCDSWRFQVKAISVRDRNL
jgi:hypothetical protein